MNKKIIGRKLKTNGVQCICDISNAAKTQKYIDDIESFSSKKPNIFATNTIMSFVEYAYYKSKGLIVLNRFNGKRVHISKPMPVEELKIIPEDDLQKMNVDDLEEYLYDINDYCIEVMDILKYKTGGGK